jgi:nicotinamide riboside transporter PnuC
MTHELTTLYLAAQPWLASACGLLGSLLLALKGRSAPWGWVFFAFSNAGWLVFGYGNGHWFFLVQQIGFSITSAIGIWKWLIEPRIARLFERLFEGDKWTWTWTGDPS